MDGALFGTETEYACAGAAGQSPAEAAIRVKDGVFTGRRFGLIEPAPTGVGRGARERRVPLQRGPPVPGTRGTWSSPPPSAAPWRTSSPPSAPGTRSSSRPSPTWAWRARSSSSRTTPTTSVTPTATTRTTACASPPAAGTWCRGCSPSWSPGSSSPGPG